MKKINWRTLANALEIGGIVIGGILGAAGALIRVLKPEASNLPTEYECKMQQMVDQAVDRKVKIMKKL